MNDIPSFYKEECENEVHNLIHFSLKLAERHPPLLGGTLRPGSREGTLYFVPA